MKMKKISLLLLSLILIFALIFQAGCSSKPSTSSNGNNVPNATNTSTEKKYRIATVVKLSGVAWFDRMNEGVKKFAKDTGIDAFQVGPEKADAALQVKIIEDLIAQKVDAICVVPNSPEALEPVLKKAMDKGIVVISHEASNIQNVNYDIEAFDNAAYGDMLMENLAKYMNYKGEYATFVGHLTATSHNEWVDAAVKLQKEKYPDMKLVANKIESNEDQQTAYEKTKELLKAYPQLSGIQGSAMTDAPGAALAVEEMGLIGKVHIVGTSLVSVSGKYLKSGAIDMIAFWDPADAGYAMNKLALMVLEHKEIKNGTDLGVPGYDNLVLNGKVLYGKAWITVTKENMNDYNF